MRAMRNRGLFFGLVALLIAIWILKSALKLAGAAIQVIVVIALILLVSGWVITKVGKGTRR